jgi:hypothetical protein
MLTQSIFIVYDIINESENPIVLNVEIGYGQIAQSLLFIDDTSQGTKENSFELIIGKSNELIRKELSIFTTIHDIQTDTDKIYMKLVLKGGKSDNITEIFNTVLPQPGGLAHAQVRIIFI